jgi:O-antigen/teichoic acid export membrane protein
VTRDGLVHDVSRGAFWLALEKAAALVSGMAYVALLMRWLGPTKYGIMTLALVCTGFATTATGNFEMFLERYAAEYEARQLILTLRRAQLLALVVKLALGLAAGALLLAATPRLAAFFDTPELLLLIPLLALTVVFDGFSTTGRATLYGIQQFRWVSVLAMLFHVAKTLMVGLLWWSRQGLVSLALGLTVLTVLLAMAQTAVPLWLMRRAEDHEPPSPERSWRGLFSSMFRYCLPLLGGRITFLSGQNLSKLILGKLFGTTLLGYFTFAWQTVERFVELAHTLPSSLLPTFTRLVARGERERLRSVFDQSLRLVQTVACALSFVVFVFARELTLVFGSPLFEPAIPMLRVLALVPVARTAQQPFTLLFQSLRRPGTVLALALIKFATEFGGYFLLVTTLGIVGAAWANLAGAVVSYLAAMMLLARILPEGARERARAGLRAGLLLAPLLALTLLGEWRIHGLPQVWFHAALLLPATLGVFALGLVRRQDLEKLADVPLTTAWTRRLRDAVLAVLGLFARLAEPRGAS